MLGATYISKELINEAKIYLRHSFLLNSSFPEAQNALGVVCMAKDKRDIAKKIWEAVAAEYSGQKTAANAEANLKIVNSGQPFSPSTLKY